MKQWIRRVCIFTAALAVVAYALTDPADHAVFPAANGQGVTVYVVDHGYHAGLVVPTAALRAAAVKIARGDRARAHVLRAVAQDYPESDWLEIGWGAAGFYRHASSVTDVSVKMAARALFVPTPSVVQVVPVFGAPDRAFPGSKGVALPLSSNGFEALAAALSDTFARDAHGTPQPDGVSLYGQGAFYGGQAEYHIFNTCNHWASKVLRSAGAPSSWVWSMTSIGLITEISVRTDGGSEWGA